MDYPEYIEYRMQVEYTLSGMPIKEQGREVPWGMELAHPRVSAMTRTLLPTPY